MSAAGNFQFSLHLRESGLSESERSNLERIFAVLSPERKMEVIDHWPKYLDKLLEIRHYAEEERKRNIASAFERIEKLLSDAELRSAENERRAKESEAGFRADLAGSAEYDRSRKLEALMKIGRPKAPEEDEPVPDPLAAFL